MFSSSVFVLVDAQPALLPLARCPKAARLNNPALTSHNADGTGIELISPSHAAKACAAWALTISTTTPAATTAQVETIRFIDLSAFIHSARSAYDRNALQNHAAKSPSEIRAIL
jgi:hypothetical protein